MHVALLVAAIAAGSPAAAVQHSQEKVRSALDAWFKAEGPSREKARSQARAAVGELIDFDALAKSTLGAKWDALKPAERKRYTDALRGAMEANYLSKMQQNNKKDVRSVQSEILGEDKQGQDVLVKTRVHSGQDTAAIDYVMAKEKGGWRAVDVLTEGVSLAETYRDQVTRLLPRKGIEGVTAALEKKRKAIEAETEASP